MRKEICVKSWQSLNHVKDQLAPLEVDTRVWTHAIKSELCQAGQYLGYYVCTSGVTGANHGEWLFDQVWMNWIPDPGRLIRIGLAVECEWSLRRNDILDDFEKLLVARAEVRLMIFQARTAQDVNALFDLLRAETQEFTQHQCGDYYMLAGYDIEDGEFLRDGFRINTTTLDVEDVPFFSRD